MLLDNYDRRATRTAECLFEDASQKRKKKFERVFRILNEKVSVPERKSRKRYNLGQAYEDWRTQRRGATDASELAPSNNMD